MPKYFDYKVAGYYLYFTSHCLIECMHVHASDNELSEPGSAKFFVKCNGDTLLQHKGRLTEREILKIQRFKKIITKKCIKHGPFGAIMGILWTNKIPHFIHS